MALFFNLNILFLLFSLVFSDSNVPFRGSKDLKREEKNSLGSHTGIPKIENALNESSVGVVVPENPIISSMDSEFRFLDAKKCEGKTFVMWFQHGVALTSIKCEEGLSAIIHAKTGGGQETKYLKGDVTDITVNEGGTTITVNGKALSSISTSIDAPTDPSGDRLLIATRTGTEIGSDVAKVYTITVGDKNFDVYLPNKSTAEERTTYSLAFKDKIFDSGSTKTQYTLKENGDLVKGDGDDVILETEKEDSGDDQGSTTENSGSGSTSSAIGIFYVIPSLLAAILSISLF